MAIIPPRQARQIQRPQPMVRTTAQSTARTRARTTNAAHAAIVVAVAAVMHDQVPPMPDQALMIVTAHAKHALHTILMPSPQAKPTTTQHSQVAMANIQLPRRALPTGCSMILSTGLATARMHLAPIPVHLATQAVRWIARRDATAIIAKSAHRAHHPYASAKAHATA